MRPTFFSHRSILPALAFAFALVLSACSGAAPTSAPTAAPTSAPVTEPAPPTALPASATPTATAAPTQTSAPTATSAPTDLPSPTPHPLEGELSLSGLAWMPNYNMLLSFNFPGPVDPQDYRVTLEQKEYSCEVLEQYPNRLYCHGAGAKVLTTAMIRVYPAGSDLPIFEKSYWIPYFE